MRLLMLLKINNMEKQELYQVNIYKQLSVSLLAHSKYHAIDKMCCTLCEKYPDRKKYTAKIVKV